MRLSKRARLPLALITGFALVASAAGLAFTFRPWKAAAAPAPSGRTPPKADLATMQALLNSGSVSEQAALLAPPLKFAPGSKPIFPAGTAVTIKPGTLRPDGQMGTVEASLSGGKIVTLYAIAGDDTTLVPLGSALVMIPFGGDAVVPVSSALHHRPGGGPGSFTVIRNHARMLLDFSAWHGALPQNRDVIAEVHDLIRAYIQAHPAPSGQQPLAGHPAGPDGESPVNVIYNFYDALNAHDYQRAWELGGSNIAGTSYDNWVAGYAGTAGLYVTAQDMGGGVVQVSITATREDGSVQDYAGTYTIRLTDYMSWTIVSADIHSTSGPAPSPARQLGGDAYWLANGGQWYVHGMTLQISRGGPTGLAGTETWNEFGAVVTGTVHLAFTAQPDGSLRGIYTDDPVYTKTGDASAWPGPSLTSLKNTSIRLVPAGPMHATVAGSPFGGNDNLCQQGLPNASQYCGA
jgi:hypothetical protein